MRFFVPPPPGLGFWHPASLIATFGGVGLLRPASGTIGSFAAAIVAWGVASLTSPLVLLPLAVLAYGLGIWAASALERASGTKDPSSVVIDEVAGQWLVLAFMPLAFKWYLAAFLTFRFFDIVKVWPASWADKDLKGGLGVMTDDIFAGIYALIVCLLLLHVI